MEANETAPPELELINPISCAIRESPRARHVRLKLSLYDASLTVIVPQGYNRKHIPEVLREKRRWIERTRAEILRRRAETTTAADDDGDLPSRISLRAVNEEWSVEYANRDNRFAAVYKQDDFSLLVCGDLGDGASTKALRRWVHRKAKAHLVPWLLFVSRDRDLPVQTARVKALKSCWASCSPQQNISLSRNLIFLPAPLVEYVFLHELCHTIHLNHSRRFWAHVRSVAPNYKELEKELRTAWKYLPSWMDES